MLVLSVVVAALAAYLLGNLNGAVCMSAIIAHEDVRDQGSGNAGLTNFIRNYGAGKALYVILIDGGKAAIACVNAGLMLEPFGYYQEGLALGAVAVILGHIFPALLGFKGGKGILSGCITALVMDWRVGLLLLVVFGAVYLLTGYVSLGSILGAATYAIGFVVLHHDRPLVMAAGVFIGVLAIIMHHGNIKRLLKGQERKTDLFARSKK